MSNANSVSTKKTSWFSFGWRGSGLGLLLCLLSFSWHCGPPSAVCSERSDAQCATNLDCSGELVCWQCECIACPVGRKPCGPGKFCVDVVGDANNCGACGAVCPRDKPLCAQGKCSEIGQHPKEVLIAAGAFEMGSPLGEIGRYEDEVKHKVTINQAFYMWKTEITQKEFRDLMFFNPAQFGKCGDECPVESVSWNEALSFCNRMSKQRGLPECFDCKTETLRDSSTNVETSEVICTLKAEYTTKDGLPAPQQCWGMRLPTEAEWEYAARAGTQTAIYNGDILAAGCGPDRLLNEIAWYCGNGSSLQTVGQKQPNAWGLLDILGSVREWTWDFYAAYPTEELTDPPGPKAGSGRVVRGGCWRCRAAETRAAYRFDHDSVRREFDLGFRIVRNAPASAQK